MGVFSIVSITKKKISFIFQHLEEEREKKIQSYEEHIVKKMASMVQLSDNDVQQFMEEHRKNMELYNGEMMLSCLNHELNCEW